MRMTRPRNWSAETGRSSPSSASPLVTSARFLFVRDSTPASGTRRITRCTKNRPPCSKRITSPRDTASNSHLRTNKRSPGRIQGNMLPPNARKQTEPRLRTFREIYADSLVKFTREFSICVAPVTAMREEAIRASAPRSALQSAVRRGMRAPTSCPSFDAAKSACRGPEKFAAPRKVRQSFQGSETHPA
jgi:hypothetical protein